MNFIGLTSLVKRLPFYADDVKQNIKELFSKELEGLAIRQMYGIALAAGYYLKNEQMLNCIRAEAKIHLEEADATAAKFAVVVTSMTSTYHNFNSSVTDEEIKALPADLHLSAFSDPSILKTDFELYCLAISIFLKCKYCTDLHIKSLISQGVSKAAINNVARIVSVLRAAKAALEIENIRSYEFIARGPNF
ncbi:peroxiredoxin reductase [endosymbiont of Acanthamoeba sp. UWC8]|uniref:carboxymuconolactone decarboxylase family protein n=1 Tax=endosymbiont of Acanthamoeba sp. UWC8 TaxID=86106 RepID=UPI0004D1836A|nr:carboxymuconolactone decarboxylase family protein [endosymbiont of Acanthamoeba sp. UWC8]AIF81888.1 peroxiredoxin reductase [endosymbiont of Acanthamoeba sp. UWC8]